MRDIPEHVAIIMDGNHRWAQSKGLKREVGHRIGAKNVRPIAEACLDHGVTTLTLFAFSTENWKRPRREVEMLIELMWSTLRENIDEFHQRDTRLHILGDLTPFPAKLQTLIHDAEEKTRCNQALTLNICLNYGGQRDIVEATRRIAEAVERGSIESGDIDERVFESYLASNGSRPPDLCIRTGGEQRLSNFVLWELAYSELYFSDKYWPEFNKADLNAAMNDYESRVRRFGGRENVTRLVNVAS